VNVLSVVDSCLFDSCLFVVMGAVIDPDHLAIVTEFCSNGSVEDIIQHHKLQW